MLDCGHSYCLDCLAKCIKSQPADQNAQNNANGDVVDALSQSVMSRPEDSLVGNNNANAGQPNAAPQRDDSLHVKCPQCREVTKAESLNSLRKNFPLLDLLKLHKASIKFLTEHIKTHRLNTYRPIKKLPVTNLNKTDDLA